MLGPGPDSREPPAALPAGRASRERIGPGRGAGAAGAWGALAGADPGAGGPAAIDRARQAVAARLAA